MAVFKLRIKPTNALEVDPEPGLAEADLAVVEVFLDAAWMEQGLSAGHDHRFGHYLMRRLSRGVSPPVVAAVFALA